MVRCAVLSTQSHGSDIEKFVSEFAQDHAELGAALNGFSLNESDHLSAAIERTGQAVDATYMSTTRLVRYHHFLEDFIA